MPHFAARAFRVPLRFRVCFWEIATKTMRMSRWNPAFQAPLSTIMQSWLSSCLLVLSLEPAATQCMRDTNTKRQKVCQGHLDCADFPVEKALPLWSDKQSRKLRAYAALNPVGRCAWFTTHHPCKVKPEEPKFLVLPYFCSTRLEFQETAKQWKTCFLKPLSCSISLVSH